MQAAAIAQSRLLALQSVDTAIAQLEHRRRSLPELARIAELQQVRRRQGEQLIAANTRVSDLELEVGKAESDLVPVRERLERDEQRVNAGVVTDPKQLSALIDEIDHLKRRISDLEDVELELMERLEQATTTRDEIVAARAEGEAELRALLASRDEQLAVLDADLARRNAERSESAGELPADLLALYDRIRLKSGSGAAELLRRRCSGCQLEATAADLNRYRTAPAEEVLRCVECDRILVRTAESGL